MKLVLEHLQPANVPLVGFSGNVVRPEGRITLPITVGTTRQVTRMTEFLVVKIGSPYNAIVGRPTLNALKAFISSNHLTLKFSTKRGIGVVRGDQQMTRHCYVAALKGKNKETLPLEGLNLRDEPASRGQLAEDLVSVPLDEDEPEKTIRVGSNFPLDSLFELVSFLKDNAKVFAWSTTDMPRIDPSAITHRLSVGPSSRPIQQKKRNFAPECWKAISEEVDKLLDIGFIQEIKMHPEGKEKTSFITSMALTAIRSMPFGLKNAKATYQWLVNMVFKRKMGRNVEAYVDDMVVKSLKADQHTLDLAETFSTLRKYNMKLNPSKCAFSVTSGKFLGFVTQ
ncbi:PREDICTED: uncharacterized protein LOC104593283 [Nelumbo nucifera]|uniref:Uncharacterized protein LOC104593283 n=1 Tax=Nelumbo nucifera TaxID=4432 RepID=A0A1U7ZCN2_NELNU|nr:PREDICTED: uncharacterized protein LOC104593283 [Nelumbo nucifera]